MTFQSLVNQLESTETELVHRLADIEDSRKRLKAQIKDVRNTIKKFGGNASNAAVTVSYVIGLIVAVLAERGICHGQVLLEEIETRIEQAGQAVTGIQALVEKALSDDRFVESEDGWTLASRDNEDIDK